jgi:hypothetical protein
MLEQSLNITEQQALMPPMFDLYIDESGSQKPSQKDTSPFFAMGGVLFERKNENVIKDSVTNFKTKWYPRLKISELSVPLHSTEIRSKKQDFRELENFCQTELDQFYTDLNNMATGCPITIHACVISRYGYHNRFYPIYGDNTWDMMKSCFYIVVERAAKDVQSKGGRMKVYFEGIGKRENKVLKQYFKELGMTGNIFSPSTAKAYAPFSAEDFSNVLTSIEHKTKTNLIMQLADYCLHPIADIKLHTKNRAHQAFQAGNIIVDCQLSRNQISDRGIKYYCY